MLNNSQSPLQLLGSHAFGHWRPAGKMASPVDSFPSLTAEGQPALMSHTGVAQIYSLSWKY
jgi:hypothetical protein